MIIQSARMYKCKNDRKDITKPMEDYGIVDKRNGIFIIADGTTRPHEEYQQVDYGSNLACLFAQKVSKQIHIDIINSLKFDIGIIEAIKGAIIRTNNLWACEYPNLITMKYPPTAALLVAVIREDVLYYFNTCDTIGIILRGENKITLTERHNRRVKREQCFNKDVIYQSIYNHYDNIYGYGMMNGDERFNQFVSINHIRLESGDRIILSSDGMFDYFETTPARFLCEPITPREMLLQSKRFDVPPYSKYADDKIFIVICIDE